MLTPITAPTTRNLMDPETVLTRLKLPDSDLEELTEQVAEASAIVCRYLGFECAYGTWRETFTGASGDRLYLGARPAWSIEGLTYLDGALQAADTYRLERGPHGESSLVRPLYSSFYASAWPAGAWTSGPGVIITGSSVVPDWSVDYTAGWWLPEMSGTKPAGVDTFPVDLQRDFLRVVRWLRSSGGDIGELAAMGIAKMSNEGASIEFQAAADIAVDPSGIPSSLLVSLPLYRRPV